MWRCLALCAVLTGCYTYLPLTSGDTPPAGEAVALEISDAGRVGLSDRFGPGLLRVEGRLTSGSAQEYALNVNRVSFINAPASRWSGELVRIERGFIGRVELRKLSRTRTALTVGTVVLVVGAVFIGTDLFGFFEGTRGDPDEPPGPISNRVGH
jgi:hypothetical protein